MDHRRLLRAWAHGGYNNRCLNGILCTECVTRRSPSMIKLEGISISYAKNMAIPAGLEPATYCLEGSCSIQLSQGAVQSIGDRW